MISADAGAAALAELHLEAWLPADQATADALRDRSDGGARAVAGAGSRIDP